MDSSFVRHRKPLIVWTLLLAASPCLFAGKEYLAGPNEQVAADQLLVGLRPGADINQIVGALSPRAAIATLSRFRNTYLLHLPPGNQAAVSRLLAAHPMVSYVEPNHVRSINVGSPNDTKLVQQWALTTINAFQAWNYFPDSFLTSATASTSRVKVAVVDTGADCTHPDFKNAGGTSTDSANGGQLAWSSSSAIVATTITAPICSWEDDNGHGTHTAGIVGAATNNATGVASLGFPLQLVIIKVLQGSGSGTDFGVAQGIYAAVSAGAQVVSMSLGGTGYSETLQQALDFAWANNVLVVAASGNTGSNALEYPGAGNHVLGVAATDDTNTVANFSTFGSWVKIAAPGVNVLSTLPIYGSSDGTSYGLLSGTSMATPHVAALAGLLYAANPGISVADVAQRIQQTAQSPHTGWDQYIGYGVINAAAALGNTPGPFTQGSFTGQIVDVNGNPLTGATVTAGTQSYTTINDPGSGNITGLFRVANLSPGTYPITVTASGQTTVNTQGVIVAGADTMLTIQMGVSYGTFNGTVSYNGVPVAGAAVKALANGTFAGDAITSSSGTYNLSVQPGSYTLTASAPNYIDTSSGTQPLLANGTVTVNLALSALGNITGTVTDVNGLPVSNAHVDFTDGSFTGGATTNASGAYATYGVPSGTYTVTASASGYTSVSTGSISVTTNTSTPVNFQFSTGVALTNGLLVYLPFNEGAGTVASDLSGNSYNATLSNTTWTSGLLFASALSFNGSTSSASTPSIPFTNTYSASVWVNPVSTSQANWGTIVVAQSHTGIYLGMDQTGTKYKVVVNGGAGTGGSCAFQFITEGCAQSASITSGWHLVTGTYDGVTAILYVDGVMVASDTFTAPASVNSSLQIGTGWNGALQALRIYGRALTASEVAALYAQKGNLTLTKTADAALVAASGSIGYTLSVGNPGSITALSAALNDPLPAGTGVGWSISPAYSGPGTCSIASGALSCNFGNLSSGGSASVHVTSATTAASCGVYPNNATFSATSFGTVQASATTTVQCGQSINFGPLPGVQFGSGTVTVAATATSNLPVAFSLMSGPCTLSTATVTLTGVGTCVFQATQDGNNVYTAATPVNQSLTITQGSQTINFAALPNAAFGTSPAVSATATSGLTVAFNSQTGTICSVTNSTVTLLALGTCTIQATQAGNTNWAAATPVNRSFTVTQGSQTITFGALLNAAFGTSPTVSATANSGLAVSFTASGNCTIANSTVTLVTVGNCTIQATQAGNTNWAAATPVNRSFTVTQGSQTITFGALPNAAFGTAPTVSATATSGLGVSFTASGNCTIANSTVTLVTVGNCTIQATQTGNANWAAATPVNRSFTVTQGSQTITFGALLNAAFGTSPTVSATASSGLAVSFTASGNCTIANSTVTLVTVGNCTIQATQTGNANWAAATAVNQSFTITLGSQTIAFGALPNAAFGTSPTVGATASSGLAVSFTASGNCTIANSTVTLVTVGTCTIQATQAGNTNWAAATAVSQGFTITQGSQTITFGALPNAAFGTSPTVSAAATSGLAVSFSASGNCTISSNTITLVTVGTCTIQATQAGNTNWAAATAVSQGFTITQGSQTITFGALPNAAFGTSPTVSATATSGLAVSFMASGNCTISSNTITLVTVGTCTIQATQAGNANWTAATAVSQGFTIMQGSQTVAFGALPNAAFGTSPTVSATATSGLTVSFSASGNCTIADSTVTLVTVGNCTIQATQAGNANWAAATAVSQGFTITQGSQTITFGALPNAAFGTSPTVSAAATSGLTVSFSASGNCTIANSTVTMVTVGNCTIQATQAGNANWAAATAVSQGFTITQGSQTITFGTLPNAVFGTLPTVSATATSGLAVNFTASGNCTISNSVVTLVTVGTCTIQATQTGNTNWAAATAVSQGFTITQGSQSITFGALSAEPLGTAPFALTATASSTLPVSFTSTTSSVCTVATATVTLVAIGTCTIQATQVGNPNWTAASPVNQNFTVTAGIVTLGLNSLSFPAVVVGKSSSTQTFLLQNTGNAPLTISSITVAGADGAHYQYSTDPAHPCPIGGPGLAAGATCTLDLIFAPLSQGSHNSAQLTISDNSSNVPGAAQSIGLSGVGIVLSSISISANSQSLVYNTTEQFTATGTYSDTSTAPLTNLATWASSNTNIASLTNSGLATALIAGQTNITASFSGVTSNSFQLTVVAGAAATIAVSSGSGQTATVGTGFGAVLQALVKDSGGNVAPNASVTFTAPSTGASGTFSNGLATYTTTTNTSGIATSLAFSANNTFGSYSVNAAVSGVGAPASFSLTNFAPPALTITETATGAFVQGQSSGYAVQVSDDPNAGPTYGTVTVTVGLSSGLTLTGMNGGSTWTCTVATASCSTSRVLNPGNSYGLITVTVAVAYGATTASGQAGVSDAGSLPITTAAPTPVFTACDLTLTGSTTVGDVQTLINEVLGTAAPSHDLTGDGAINILDVQVLVRSALGGACSAS